MGLLCCAGSMLQCSFGIAPSVLNVLPEGVMSGTPSANIMASVPFLNILPFGMCTSEMNPMVIALTAAALGVPTPAPCIPMTVAPWAPGIPTVLIGEMPALDNESKLECLWGGMIEVLLPAQFSVMVE